ncbi:hypothetical protein ARTHRO9AX_180380 [Arthrobacter sp. 9AX]|nr:hypothetical protein ARTHRO9AX_180380 [Arthrobacter sp. 9AX]
MLIAAGLRGCSAGARGIGRACRGEHHRASHNCARQMQSPGRFGQCGTRGEDIVDNDAPASSHPAVQPPSDPHGSPDPARPAAAVQAFLASGQLQQSRSALFQDVLHGEYRHVPGHVAQEQVHRAEAALQEGCVTGGDRHQAGRAGPVGGRPDGNGERPPQAVGELVLAVPFKGQQGLCQFLPVHPGGHHRQQHPSPDIHQGRSSLFSTERLACQPADVASTWDAQGAVLGTAAHAVHRDSQREEISRRACRLVQQAQQGAPVPGPVHGRPLRRRDEVRIHPDGPRCSG